MPGCRSLAMGRLLLAFTDWEPHLPLVQLCWVLVRESRKVAGVLKLPLLFRNMSIGHCTMFLDESNEVI